MELATFFTLATFFSFVLAETVSPTNGNPTNPNKYPPINIVYTSDILGRIEEVDSSLKSCTKETKDANKCFGGLPRLAQFMDDERKKDPNTIFLTSGNFLGGHTWCDHFGRSMMAEFLNKLPLTATSLSEREMNLNDTEFRKVFDTLTCKVLVANLDTKTSTSVPKLTSNLILNISDHKIGIIGYTPSSQFEGHSTQRTVEEFEAVKKVAESPKNNVTILILLDHYHTNPNEFAAKLQEIDLAISGGNDQFSLAGNSKKSAAPLNATILSRTNAKKLYALKLNPYPKYVNKITINFDAKGVIMNVLPTSVLLDSRINKKKAVSDLLVEKKSVLESFKGKTVGNTVTDLSNDTCRKGECTIGNLLADAIRKIAVDVCMNAASDDSKKENCNRTIALVNSGLIRAPISNGKITRQNLMDAFPFGIIRSVPITGTGLQSLLEESVKSKSLSTFLQVSGLEVVFEVKPSGSTVSSMKFKSKPIETNDAFTALITEKKYCQLEKIKPSKCKELFEFAGYDMYEIVEGYMKAHSPLNRTIEGRITFINNAKHLYGSIAMVLISTVVLSIFSH